MSELKSKLNEELQKRVELIGSLLVLNSIEFDITKMLDQVQEFMEKSYENKINKLENLFKSKEDYIKIKNFFIKIDSDIFKSIKLKNLDILNSLNEKLLKEIKSNN